MSKVKKEAMCTYVFAFPQAYFSYAEALEIIERRNWYDLWRLSHHVADVIGVNKKIYYVNISTFNMLVNSEKVDVYRYWIFIKPIEKAILVSQARASLDMAKNLGVTLKQFATTLNVIEAYRAKLKND